MMNLALPFRRRPFRQHIVVAILVLAGVGAASWATLQGLQTNERVQHGELDTAQRSLRDWQARQAAQPAGNFSQQLPASTVSDEVSRDIARFAESGRVQIQSLALQAQASTPRDVGKLQYNVAALGDYAATKAWLAALLARYPSLAVSALSLRVAPNDAARLTSSVTLVLYVKD